MSTRDAESGGGSGGLEDAARHLSGSFSRVIQFPGAGTRIGRAEDNDVVVDDLLVSRRHALLRITEGGWELEDLGSANGTFVNGHRITRARMAEGDVVAIGHHMFRLVEWGLEEFVDDGRITFQARRLTVEAKAQRFLDEVSFALEQNSFLAVVGPSGSGKSTLLNALTGFRPATEGSVLYDGRDLYADYEELRLRLGFVPQEDILHPQLSARAALSYAAELRFPDDVEEAAREQRVDEVLGELGVLARADSPIGVLSGGERRRVAVALELLAKPSLLFLDEPTSGLDPGYERTLMELLRGLANRGRTIVAVTHSVQSIGLCDRALFLAPGGRSAYFGPPDLALAYFEQDDFPAVFRLLSSNGDTDWQARYRAHPYHATYVEEPARDVGEPERSAAPAAGSIAKQRPRRLAAQVGLLGRRYLRVLAGDRRNLVLLALQPIVLGLLMLVALPADELTAPASGEFRAVSRAGLVLLMLVLASTWIGASNAIREIVKELPIIRRERAVGLSISAYVLSKTLVLGALTAVQCGVMAAIALARQGSHDSGSVIGSQFAELVAVAVLTGLAGMALGLLISSLSRTSDQAMTVLPVVLVVEMVLALGTVFPDVAEKFGLEQGAYLAGTNWALAASASTVDLERLQSVERVARVGANVQLNDPLREFRGLDERLAPEPRWDHDEETWLADTGALAGLTVILIAGSALALRRRGPEA
jgi:ABC-type multidrug transport system ATPase subunit